MDKKLPTVRQIRLWLWRFENGGELGVLINQGLGLWKMIWCPGQESVCTIKGNLTAIKRIAKGLMGGSK